MVQLQEPTPGVLINIECTAWSKVETDGGEAARRLQFSYDTNQGISNVFDSGHSVHIEHDRSRNRGSLHIELLMD